jgi:KilA-N domain/Protein of unknown function (DUF3627)
VSTSKFKMLSQIVFTQIRDNFYYGYYGEFQVVVDKRDGYINATKLCSDGGKKFCHWSETKVSKELISTLRQYNFNLSVDLDESCEPWAIANYAPVGDITKYVHTFNTTEQDKAISGTYCHPLLIPHIACWVSPTFALKAASIINFFLVEEWKAKLEASERSAAQLLHNLHEQHLALEEAQQTTTATSLALQSSEENNKLLKETLEDCQQLVRGKNNVIDIKKESVEMLETQVCDKAREKQVWASSHAFTLLHLHNETSKRPFYVIRCQGRRMGAAINKIRRKFPTAEVVYQQRKVPNAINLYSRLKQQKVVESTHNYCTPICSQQQLLHHLNNLCGTTYPASNPMPLNCYVLEENTSM